MNIYKNFKVIPQLLFVRLLNMKKPPIHGSSLGFAYVAAYFLTASLPDLLKEMLTTDLASFKHQLQTIKLRIMGISYA